MTTFSLYIVLLHVFWNNEIIKKSIAICVVVEPTIGCLAHPNTGTVGGWLGRVFQTWWTGFLAGFFFYSL